MSRFDLNKMGKKIEESKKAEKVELGKTYLNEASLALRDPRKKTQYIEIDSIVPNPDNKLSMNSVPWLKQNIKLNGLLQPLLVSQMEDGRYMLYGGHQRFEAISQLKAEGEWGDTVEVKVIDLSTLNLPEKVRPEIRKKLLLRAANIQRGNGYDTDADRYVVIQDWKEIYDELRRCGVKVLEYGLDEEGEQVVEEIKGKTRDLVANKMGISPAQVEKFDRVENRGTETLKQALKEDKISVATAAEVASKPQDEQNQILKKIKDTKEISPENKITGDDVILAEKAIKDKKSSASQPEAESADVHMLTKKGINSDLKKVFKLIREAGEEGIVLDDSAYLDYLKHIGAIEKICMRVIGD